MGMNAALEKINQGRKMLVEANVLISEGFEEALKSRGEADDRVERLTQMILETQREVTELKKDIRYK